jgi:AraC-like DNA-binding protein
MKVLPFTIPKAKRDALILQEDKQAQFYGLLHQHEELQLSYVINGSGSIVVGDSVSSFNAGDILVLGGNIPHVFKSNLQKENDVYMLSIFFTETSFGDTFFETEELKSLQSFFKKAQSGFKIEGASKEITNLFTSLWEISKLERFIKFIQLLRTLNNAKYEFLSTYVSEKKYSDNEGQRMSAVFSYTIQHFREEITLARISKEASMTQNAFCKYFKKRTRKTYVGFLNELRIEEACKLLKEDLDSDIPSVAERAGFQNISNFNRKFKQLKGCTPSAFRN